MKQYLAELMLFENVITEKCNNIQSIVSVLLQRLEEGNLELLDCSTFHKTSISIHKEQYKSFPVLQNHTYVLITFEAEHDDLFPVKLEKVYTFLCQALEDQYSELGETSENVNGIFKRQIIEINVTLPTTKFNAQAFVDSL